MAQGLQLFDGALLCDSTGALVGALGSNGREYLFPTAVNAASSTAQPVTYVPSAVAITGGTVNGTPVGATTPNTGAFTTLSATAAATLSPANAAVTLSPTGTGTVVIAPSTVGAINNTSLGATTRSTAAVSSVAVTATDSTGTPGNVTNNAANGRAAFAAAGNSVVVTNSAVAATDTVQVTLLGAADATLLYITGVTVAAGSFTVTGNAAATATKGFMFTVIKS